MEEGRGIEGGRELGEGIRGLLSPACRGIIGPAAACVGTLMQAV